MGRSVLNIITLNVRGLGSVAKRRKLFLWIKKQQPDIIFMQETHCAKSNVNNIDSHFIVCQILVGVEVYLYYSIQK